MIKENLLPQICAELYELLNILGQNYINALPKNIFKNISEKRDLTYTNKFDINEGISEKNFSKESINILLGFDLKYWSSYVEKQRKISLYKENEKKYQDEIKEKYNPNKLFKTEKTQFQNDSSVEKNITLPPKDFTSPDLFPVKISIGNKLKNFFSRLFKN